MSMTCDTRNAPNRCPALPGVSRSGDKLLRKSHTARLRSEHLDQLRHDAHVSQLFTLDPHHRVRVIARLEHQS